MIDGFQPAGARILIIGVRRTGKSTLALYLAIESGARLIAIWDPNNNFRSFPAARSKEELETLLDDLSDNDYEYPQIIPLYAPQPKLKQKLIVFRYVPHPNFLAAEFETFFEVLRRRVSGHWALLVDESDEDIQNRQGMSNALAFAMRRMPTEQDYPETVEVIQMTHSPQDVYARARNLITDVYVFRTNGQAELDWIEDYTQDPNVRDQVRALSTPTKKNPGAPRHVMHISDGVGGEKEIFVLTEDKEWFIQIGSNRGQRPEELKEDREREYDGEERTTQERTAG